MRNLETVHDDDLKKRLDMILVKIHSICQDLAPKVEQLGRHREEAAIIYDELFKRGVVPKYEPGVVEKK